jgi:uncharacterized protein YhbP (UPF0306 family)
VRLEIQHDSAELWARFTAIVRANSYMTLATADDAGRPWATPVWYATVDCREFVWVSDPHARHSRNLAARPELAITIFDSHQAPGTGTGVYLWAVGSQVASTDLDRALAIFTGQARHAGLRKWTRSDVDPPARHRLYHATAIEQFVLSDRDERIPVTRR